MTSVIGQRTYPPHLALHLPPFASSIHYNGRNHAGDSLRVTYNRNSPIYLRAPEIAVHAAFGTLARDVIDTRVRFQMLCASKTANHIFVRVSCNGSHESLWVFDIPSPVTSLGFLKDVIRCVSLVYVLAVILLLL